MDFINSVADFVSWLPSQPWAFTVPFVAAVLADWGLGSVNAKLDGTFKKESVFDWVKTTVGYKQGAAVVGSVALAYFMQGQHASYLALVPLVSVNGAAFLSVLSDVEDKFKELFLPKK
jgi:hypothetical protein